MTDEIDVEIANPDQPHCATVLVLDTSGSMAEGDKIEQLKEGLTYFRSDVMEDSLAVKRIDLAVITFGEGIHVLQEFGRVDQFAVPRLEAAGQTPMGDALLKAMALVEQRKAEYRAAGTDCWRPWIFLITDGQPTDMDPGDERWSSVVGALHAGERDRKFLFFAVGVEPADMSLLTQIAPPTRPPVKLEKGKFREMFLWLSSSQRKISRSKIGEQINLDPLVGWVTLVP